MIAIGTPVKNPPVANLRMHAVHRALAEQRVELLGLEIWSVDGDGRRRILGLGDL